MQVNGETWEVYAVGWRPFTTFLVALMEIVPQKPDLVVSGINLGKCLLGCDLLRHGGAALEAASFEIPALASSVQILQEEWDSYHLDVDFSAAAHFTSYFADLLLKKKMPFDVDVLNVTVPVGANPQTRGALHA